MSKCHQYIFCIFQTNFSYQFDPIGHGSDRETVYGIVHIIYDNLTAIIYAQKLFFLIFAFLHNIRFLAFMLFLTFNGLWMHGCFYVIFYYLTIHNFGKTLHVPYPLQWLTGYNYMVIPGLFPPSHTVKPCLI